MAKLIPATDVPTSLSTVADPEVATARCTLPKPLPKPLPLVLLDSIDVTDPVLFARIHRTISSCEHLSTQERRVLRAVLSNIPSDPDNDNSLVHRMLDLEPPQLQVLAQVFEAGLIAAGNFGGRPLSSVGTPVERVSVGSKRPSPQRNENDVESSSSSKRLKLDGGASTVPSTSVIPRSDIAAPVPPASPSVSGMDPPPTAVELLFQVLELPGMVPKLRRVDRERSRLGRRGSLAEACLTRQNNTCPITGRTSDLFQLETAHIVPHSIAALETVGDLPYWQCLRLCLGPTLSDHIFNLVAGSNSFLSFNGIAIDPTLHSSLFDHGIFWLISHLPGNFKQDTAMWYDVEFKWRASPRFLRTMTTDIPQDPEDQLTRSSTAYVHLETAHRLNSGDRFRLFTPDIESYPLPHPLLLSLHARLWEMIAACGLSETAKSKSSVKQPHMPRGRGMSPARRPGSRQSRGSRSGRGSDGTPSENSGSATPLADPGSAAYGLGYSGAQDTVDGCGEQITGEGGSGRGQERGQTLGVTNTAYLDFQLGKLVASAEENWYPSETDEDSEDQDDTDDIQKGGMARELREFHKRMWELGYFDSDEGWFEEEEEDIGSQPSPGFVSGLEKCIKSQQCGGAHKLPGSVGW